MTSVLHLHLQLVILQTLLSKAIVFVVQFVLDFVLESVRLGLLDSGIPVFFPVGSSFKLLFL